MATDLSVTDSAEMEGQKSSSAVVVESTANHLSHPLQRPGKLSILKTARISIRPNDEEGSGEEMRTPSPANSIAPALLATTPEPASPHTPNHYVYKEAAEEHGGRESSSFMLHEKQMAFSSQRVRRESSTLDKSLDKSTDKSITRHTSEKIKHEKKIGHRRVDEGGEVTYKRIQSKQIMGSIQLGIQHTVGSLASKPKRDLLMNDFFEMETISFPPDGSSITPAHHYNEFRFKVYAPIAFRYFRDLFGIAPDDFLMSMCAAPLRQLSNPGASGSIFYLTDDDEFIIKTVQKKECEFLQKLLPGYYMNLSQNPRTLLPKFFGLYCFHYNTKNVRLVAMNNLLPSDIKMHEKYDLKGSTFRRKASKAERQKACPTFKDLDFMENHPNGIFLETDKYNALIKTIQRDCMVLESFQIMDYSLLVGIHNVDIAAKEKREERIRNARSKLQRADEMRENDDVPDAPHSLPNVITTASASTTPGSALSRSRSINRQRLVAHSTAMESITADVDIPFEEDEDVPAGGIPAKSENDERLILYIGIIDILQSYRLEKKLEHTFKSIIYNGDTVSVCRPSFYAQRFQNFMGKTVFKKTPTFPLKHSPSKRKTSTATSTMRTPQRTPSHSISSATRIPIISGSTTPPPAFDEISEENVASTSSRGPRSKQLTAHSRNILQPMRTYRRNLSSTTDDYSDEDEEDYSAGSSRHSSSLHYTKSPVLHLSKTNVQITSIGGSSEEPQNQSVHILTQVDDQLTEPEKQPSPRMITTTTKSIVLQGKPENNFTSTVQLDNIMR